MKDHDIKKQNSIDLDSLNQELQRSLEKGVTREKASGEISLGQDRISSGVLDDFDIPIARPRIQQKASNGFSTGEAGRQAEDGVFSRADAGWTGTEPTGKELAGADADWTGTEPIETEATGEELTGADPARTVIGRTGTAAGSDSGPSLKTCSKSKPKKNIHWGRLVPRLLLGLVILLVIAAAGTAGTLIYLHQKGASKMTANKSEEEIRVPEGVEKDGDFVIYKGHKYQYNEDIITVLCMGVDKKISDTGIHSIGNNGSADTLVLAVLDQRTNNLTLVNISRETMADIRQYNTEGKYTGLKNMQICLAYAYGDGHQTSCENELDAVSRLMYGVPIHGYAALDYEGIAVLNDTIGGVTVDVLEDLTASDPALTAGQRVTLKGQQAQTYVRSRETALLESNNLRMERQKQYMTNYLKQLIQRTRSDITTPLQVYRAGQDHVVSDIGVDGVIYLGSKVVKSGIVEGQVFSIPGKVREGETYAEFIPDQKKLYKIILDVFYELVE